MQELIFEFQTLFKSSNIKMQRNELQRLLYKFEFLLYNNDIKTAEEISHLSNESKIIIFDEYQGNNDDKYFFVCFDYQLIIFHEKQDFNKSFLPKFLPNYNDSEKYFLKGNPISDKSTKEELQDVF